MSLYVATWIMPSFTTKDEARTIGEACGLRLIEFKRERDRCATVIFKAKLMSAVECMHRDLGYPPSKVRKFG